MTMLIKPAIDLEVARRAAAPRIPVLVTLHEASRRPDRAFVKRNF